MDVVYEIRSSMRKVGIEDICVWVSSSENIFYGELQIMDVDVRNKRPKVAKSAPVVEPKGRRSRPHTPRVAIFKNIFFFND